MSDGAFMVSVSGQIEWLDVLAAAGSRWHCKYEFVTGPDWKVIGGIEAGLSQTANVVTNGDKVVLNLPIEIIFKSTNPYGLPAKLDNHISKEDDEDKKKYEENKEWPQIVLSVYSGMQLQGYGRTHVPLQPGVHRLDVALSKPQPSSFLGYIGSFFGYQPELLQPKMLATTAGNSLIRMVASGNVQVSMNILTQNLQSMGYDMGNRDE